jgi:N-glycosylase/DNA lyase
VDFTLNLASVPFDLGHTLDSGQVFRWVQKGEWWYGVVADGVLMVKQEGESLVCSTSSDLLNQQFVRSYFRLDDDLERIYSKIMKDSHVTEAIQRYYGLRLIKQDVWECLVSFVIATNANIPRIKLMISKVCEKFGEETDFEGNQHRLFPKPDSLGAASIDELTECGLGYRARFVKSVAEKVSARSVYPEELMFLDYERARDMLIEKVLGEKTLLGIGRKAADCVLLFSCGKDNSFPIDVWMARVLAEYYPRLFDAAMLERLKSHVSKKAKLSSAGYERISAAMRDYFGEYAGYAQQYLFHRARNTGME